MDMHQVYANSKKILRTIRERKPIIHQITKYDTAQEELFEIVRLSNALVTNIGTLNDCTLSSVTALLGIGIAGVLASIQGGLGRFQTALFDSISTLDGALLMQRGKLHV